MILSLPCYEGFTKFLIWPEPESVSKIKYSSEYSKIIFIVSNIWVKSGETKCSLHFQSISCYGLLSQDPISDPQPTGRSIILPFFHGSRYAAIPGTCTDGNIQVDICLSRPESLVYHDKCLHLADLKVSSSLFYLLHLWLLFRFPKICKVSRFMSYSQWVSLFRLVAPPQQTHPAGPVRT